MGKMRIIVRFFNPGTTPANLCFCMAADQLRPLDYQDHAILFRGLEISQDLEPRCRDTHTVISSSLFRDIEV